MSVTEQTLSFEAFLALNGEEHIEWVDGRLVEMSPPTSRHGRLSLFLATILQHFAQEKDLGDVLTAPFLMRLETRPSGREPDIMFIANEDLFRLTPTYLDGPADLIVEIISPESRARDRGEKFYEYESASVPEYWLLDPKRQQAEFYALDERGIYQLASVEGGVYTSRVLTGLTLSTTWLWQEPLPTLMSVLETWKLV